MFHLLASICEKKREVGFGLLLIFLSLEINIKELKTPKNLLLEGKMWYN